MLAEFRAGALRAALAGLAILAVVAGAMVATACAPVTPGAVASGPAPLAQRTAADERALLAAELAYKAARLAVETAADAGLVTPARAPAVADADMRAYGALLALREAYKGANANDWLAALDKALKAVDGLRAALNAKGA